MKKRLDVILVERGLSASRERARALIMEGRVLVDGARADKAGKTVDENSAIVLEGGDIPFVSRGGFKLDHALEFFNVDVRDKIAMDVGASTGGFTDCLLQRGAANIYAVDVGYGQLAWKLRGDPRVVTIERTNVRYIESDYIKEPIDIAVVDVSFISLKLVIPVVIKFLAPRGKLVALIKPQFEVGKGEVDKGGLVKDEQKRLRVVEDLKVFLIRECGLDVQGVCESPIRGQKGNVEYLIYAVRPSQTP
jgi:23S rRNA (cytidine1920-2'-O)/16S rRNA (cytidine1409-2'-O)-methyltransferase